MGLSDAKDPALLQRRLKGGPTAETRPVERLIMFATPVGFIGLPRPAADQRARALVGIRVPTQGCHRDPWPHVRCQRPTTPPCASCSRGVRTAGRTRAGQCVAGFDLMSATRTAATATIITVAPTAFSRPASTCPAFLGASGAFPALAAPSVRPTCST